MKIRLILADDHPTVLSGMQHEIGRAPTLEIVGLAASAGKLIALLDATVCDVLITDYMMPGGGFPDGFPLLLHLRRNWPDLKIVVFTTVDNPGMLREIVGIDVQSVLSKLDDADHLISAAHSVYAGARYYSPSVRGALRGQRIADTLSSRKFEVIRLYVAGHTIGEIALQLHRAKQTVSAQKVSAMKKLGIERDAELFHYAFEIGLSPPGTNRWSSLD
ncbi:response regulator transcription factor [Burkholderia gladioli]|uniref:response regulator transcription factor n=1 Tax=Burkholderia gladioli TaxID=28095 RepID=UPI00163F9DEC|nr:response regulator transcription factor [Burkholderia gladioli]MBU9323014.1 response regulator transcription factor [Burkholderia gladioli]